MYKNIKIYIIILLIIIIIFMLFLIINKKNTNDDSEFTLYGNDVILKLNENYIEPGYNCTVENNNLTEFVKVSNNINNKIPGNYNVIYECNEKILTRKVTVLEPSDFELNIKYNISTNEKTNKDIIVYYNIEGDAYLKAILPDGTVTEKNSGSFLIKENGIYQIEVYNIENELFEKDIEIKNIDKTGPIGNCRATLNINNTEIIVNATDENNILKYEYYDNNNILSNKISNSFTTLSRTSNNISVKVYDELENVSDIKCEIIDHSFYEPIIPLQGESILFKGETDTLKAYISKKSGYYLTRIWVKDAYTQLNKAASSEYGVNLYLPRDLMRKDMINKNLADKLIIAFNASGFYYRAMNFDVASISKYPPYDKTSVGTIVINNGNVFRNAYDHAVKTWYITGVTKDNKMHVFEDKKAESLNEIKEKQKWAQSVIDSGIRNTFNFAGPVILNGQKLSKFSSSMPDYQNQTVKKLQLMCQVNENNFVLFTSSGDNRKTAINIFLKLGCKTAVNLDGGGSIALFYKEKNSMEFKNIIKGTRELPEIGYFVE